MSARERVVAIFRDEIRRIKRDYEEILQKLRALREFISSDRFLSPRMEDYNAFMGLVSTFQASLMTPTGSASSVLAAVEWYSKKLWGDVMKKYRGAFMLRPFRPDITAYYGNQFRREFPMTLEEVMRVTTAEARRRQAYLLQAMYEFAGNCPVDRKELV